MTRFRQISTEKIGWRIVDLIGHGIAAFVMPGWWLYQFLPDILLPVIFVWSWRRDKLLSESNVAIVFHKLVHKLWIPLILFVAGCMVDKLQWVYLSGHWMVHILWDQCTHHSGYDQKSLI